MPRVTRSRAAAAAEQVAQEETDEKLQEGEEEHEEESVNDDNDVDANVEQAEQDGEDDEEGQDEAGAAESGSGSDSESDSESHSESSGSVTSQVDAEERELELAVFGSLSTDGAAHLAQANSNDDDDDDDLFVVDKSAVDVEGAKGKAKGTKGKAKREAVWEDADDAAVTVNLKNSNRIRKLRRSQEEDVVSGVEYSRRLREQFRKMNAGAAESWATVPAKKKARKEGEGGAGARAGGDVGAGAEAEAEAAAEAAAGGADDNSDDSDDEGADKAAEEALLGSSAGMTLSARHSTLLPDGGVALSRLSDANQHGVSNAVIQSVDWHQQGRLLATAGLDRKLNIFNVDGKANGKVESVFLRDMPIHTARFAGRDHAEVVISGRRKFFYWMDLESGSVGKVPGLQGRAEKSLETMVVSPDGALLAFTGYDGNVMLVSQLTKQLVGNVKMNENGTCMQFSSDGQRLYTGGDHGGVYCWDMRTRRLDHRFQDQGSVATRSLAVDNAGRRLAVGSTNGVVNIYDADAARVSRAPEPAKAVLALTTAADQVSFNHDGQLLAIMSKQKKDAMRLVNVNTLTVNQQWPTSNTPIHYASALAFSPRSGMLAMANARGRCLLYRLHHYTEA